MYLPGHELVDHSSRVFQQDILVGIVSVRIQSCLRGFLVLFLKTKSLPGRSPGEPTRSQTKSYLEEDANFRIFAFFSSYLDLLDWRYPFYQPYKPLACLGEPVLKVLYWSLYLDIPVRNLILYIIIFLTSPKIFLEDYLAFSGLYRGIASPVKQ